LALHYAGAFPLWLSPVQVWIIPIGSAHQKYARSINQELLKAGLRSELKDENETVSKKIRESEIQKIPYSIIIGDKEIKVKSIGVRDRKTNKTTMMKLEKFIEKMEKEIKSKKR